mgnify:CR=1 FL=1
MKTPKIAWKIGEVVIGIVIGIIVENSASGPDKLTLAIMCGLLSTMLLDILHNHVQSSKSIATLEEQLTLLLQAIGNKATENQQLLQALKYSSDSISRDQMPNVWKDLSWSMRNSYHATNYINADNIFGRGFSDSIKTIHAAKKTAQSVAISKVFIVDNTDELKSDTFKKLIEHHKSYCFDIKYITKQKLEQLGDLSAHQKLVSSIDFGIFDGEIVLVWKLDRNRKFVGGEVLVGHAACQPYIDFFEALQLEASANFAAL